MRDKRDKNKGWTKSNEEFLQENKHYVFKR